jgi:hypothetical protein
MDESFILQIRDYAMSHPESAPFPVASEKSIEEAETKLGFSIPRLLKSIYLKVGNGAFGLKKFPGGLIGVQGGYASDFGTLVETYEQLKRDQESEGKQWRRGLLPFFEWGCNIFSCVDCSVPDHPVYLLEDGVVSPENYNIADFFRMLVEGVDILSLRASDATSVEIINPFTGEKIRVWGKRPRK